MHAAVLNSVVHLQRVYNPYHAALCRTHTEHCTHPVVYLLASTSVDVALLCQAYLCYCWGEAHDAVADNICSLAGESIDKVQTITPVLLLYCNLSTFH